MRPSDARYVVLSNIVALLGALFTVGFAPVMLLSGSLLYPALQLVYALGYLPTLWLNHRGKTHAATTWLLLGSHLLVVSQVLVEGRGFDVHVFFMLHTMLPFLLYPPGRARWMFGLAGLAGLDLVVTLALGDRLPQLGPPITDDRLALLRLVLWTGLFATLSACAYYARQATLIAEAALDEAHKRSEDLLHNILPVSIAGRLKRSAGTIAEGHADVTVLFADIVGFTTLSSRLPPERIVSMLNRLFCQFDDLADALGLEKIKTIGDCYMVAGGLPEETTDHAETVARMALSMVRVVRDVAAETGEPLDIRVGIHTGPVVAGVIGKRKFIYDLWGDTVNLASRMESHAEPGSIQVSAASRARLAAAFRLRYRGEVEMKGKGATQTWILEGCADDPAPEERAWRGPDGVDD